jgi:hypothetical protein
VSSITLDHLVPVGVDVNHAANGAATATTTSPAAAIVKRTDRGIA